MSIFLISLVDDLGFYLSATSKNPNKIKENFLDIAGQLKKVSEELTDKQRKVWTRDHWRQFRAPTKEALNEFSFRKPANNIYHG